MTSHSFCENECSESVHLTQHHKLTGVCGRTRSEAMSTPGRSEMVSSTVAGVMAEVCDFTKDDPAAVHADAAKDRCVSVENKLA